jgi:peroxiredoxin
LVSGIFLIYVGVLIASGNLQRLSDRITSEFGDFTYKLEECTVGIFEGDIRLGDFGSCMNGDESEAALGESGDEIAIAGITTDEAVSVGDLNVGLAVNNLAPDFQTVTTFGETVSLSDFRGQNVLLNFWYTYCTPCRVEMPEFQGTFSTGSDNGFTILAINREQSAEEITEFADELGLTFPLLLDETGAIQALYNVQSYPTTLLIDKDGVITYVKLGALTAAELEALALEIVG